MSKSKGPDLPSLFDLPLEPSGSAAEPELPRERQSHAQPPPSTTLPRLQGSPREEISQPEPPSLGTQGLEVPKLDVHRQELLDMEHPAGAPLESLAASPPEPSPPATEAPAQLELGSAALTDLPLPSTPSEHGHEAAGGQLEDELREGSFGERIVAGLADLALHGAVTLILLAAAVLVGVSLGRPAVMPLVLFLAVFSFLYCAVALAFWGATPGMAWRGLVARGGGRGADSDEPLTFAQSFRRWLGAVVTLLLLGLPLLPLIWGGRSLSDRLSGSTTLRLPF